LWVRGCAALSALVVSANLATAGDFGRPKYYFEAEPGAFIIGGDPHAPEVVVPAFPWTDDERELRKLADGLVLPPDSPPVGFWGDRRIVAPASAVDPTAYAAALLASPVNSSAARYARLIDHIRNDVQRWETFLPAWRIVADLDGKRLRSIRYLSVISPAELAAVDQRVAENHGVFAAARAAALDRAASYRFAMERLVIAQPSPMAVEAERTLRDLERRLAGVVPIVARAPDYGERPALPPVRK
jgi:hypothetical protein